MMDLRPLPPLSLIADDCGAMPAPFSLRWIDCFYKFVALSFNIFKRSSHELMLAFHAGIINVADFESKEPKAFVVRLPSHTVPFCCWRIKYGFTVSSSSQVHKTPVRPSVFPSFLSRPPRLSLGEAIARRTRTYGRGNVLCIVHACPPPVPRACQDSPHSLLLHADRRTGEEAGLMRSSPFPGQRGDLVPGLRDVEHRVSADCRRSRVRFVVPPPGGPKWFTSCRGHYTNGLAGPAAVAVNANEAVAVGG